MLLLLPSSFPFSFSTPLTRILSHNHIYILFHFFCFVLFLGPLFFSTSSPSFPHLHKHFVCYNIQHNSVEHLILCPTFWLPRSLSLSISIFAIHTLARPVSSLLFSFSQCANICRSTIRPIISCCWNLSICQVLDGTDVKSPLKHRLSKLFLIMVIWLLLVSSSFLCIQIYLVVVVVV